MSFPFGEFEKKWQTYWLDQKTFRTPTDQSRPKYYVLDMFPYPSGAGLHVGHPEGYTATDIVARYKRMNGFNVLHPMGWDAFGLPAERYAMQTGVHPAITTEQNVNTFRRQLQALGFSYDWDREINTTTPDYYRWTQFIFLKIFNSWYDADTRKARPISELAVPAGLSDREREDFINRHRLAYIADIPVNWCARLGTVLANEEVDEWVSKGYTVERRPMRQWMLRITAYAERLLDDLKFVEWPAGTLELQKNWIGKSEGAEVQFKIKGWGDVLTVFTTRPDTLFGVTFMVLAPEHPLVQKITSQEQRPAVEEYIRQTSLKTDLDRQLDAGKGIKSGVFTGGYALHPVTDGEIPIYIADYVMMGYGTGAVMAVPGHDERDFGFAQKYSLPVITVVQPADGSSFEGCFSGEGVSVNSDFISGLKTAAAREKMISWLEEKKLGERRVTYKLRDWLFSRQRYWGEPIPVSFDENGFLSSESDENLPLELPPSDNFMPAATGESPLANLTDWVHYSKDKKTYKRETNTMPQWAGSCWYYLRFIDPANESELVSRDKEAYWMKDGVDLYIGGAEHAVLHLLYARFWHKVLYDLGYVSSVEPFRKLVHQGIILGEDGSKMSKSRGNVVNPDDVVREYGADSFRLFEMFMGPLEQMKPWSSRGIEGVHRFLTKVWRLFTDKEGRFNETLKQQPDEKTERLLHQTIKKVGEDIERLSFNTAISQMMILMNETDAATGLGEFGVKAFLKILSPFAPHITEEIWQRAGYEPSVALAEWPKYDAAKLIESDVEIVFQVNGKVRGRARLPLNADDEIVKQAALADEGVQRNLEGKAPKKVIVVKNKIVNIVA